MSWFDAAKFSNYAKTALKQAQKNIDKVLDIKDDLEDDANRNVSSNITNTDTPSDATSESKASVSKEADSFFDSFLGSNLKSQVSDHIAPHSSSVASIDVCSDDVELSPKHKGKLRERKSLQKDNTKHDATQGVENSPSLPASLECEFVGLHNASVCSDAEIKNSRYTNSFDDIDLSDTDTNVSCSNVSDISSVDVDDVDVECKIISEILHGDGSDNRCEISSKQSIRNNETVDNNSRDADIIVKTDSMFSSISTDSSANDNVNVQSHEDSLDDVDKFSKEISNVSCIENSETVECTSVELNSLPATDDCSDMVAELTEMLNEGDLLVDSNNEILIAEQLCDSRSHSDSPDDKMGILDSNKILSDACSEYEENEAKNENEVKSVNTECNENEAKHVSELQNTELNLESFSTDSTFLDVASIQSEVGVTSKIVESKDSLVHIDDILKTSSFSSSLCVVESTGSDPLELIMKQAESILLTPTDSESILITSTNSVVEDINLKLDTQEDISVVELNIPHPDACEGQLLEVNQFNEKIATLNDEVKKLHSLIEARETKIIDLSKQNISFQESISVYQNQINQLELVNQGDDEEMENMRQEFTKRIAECDIKCVTAIKERDYCKAKHIETEASLRQSTNEQVSVLTNSLLEKEETIKDLLSEGEVLAKKELEKNIHIKKLRVKLKDMTTKNTTLAEQNTGFEVEVQKLKDVIVEKENNEKKRESELKKLEGITDSQEDEVSTLKDTLDDMEEKYRAMESTLKNTYSEINRLNLDNAQKDSEINESSHAIGQRKVLEDKLKDLEKTSKVGKEELLIQLEDLQLAYSRLEHQLARREDELKKEIEDLHSRLEHAMYRNQELSQSVSAATKPLLRQIGNLQSTYAVQSEGWECVEKSLNDRLISLQDQLALAVEKERAASEIAIEATSKLKAVKAQDGTLRSEKTNLQIAFDKESNRCKEIESEWKIQQSNFETKLSKLKVVVLELEGDKKVLEEQLSAERIRYESDTLRMSTQLSLQQQQQQQQQQLDTSASRASSRRSSRNSSISGDIDTTSQKTSSTDTPLERYLTHSSSFHEGFQKGPVTTTAASIEHLKSQLRSREGEVFVLHEQIKELEKTKASLAQELVNLANQVEELECSNHDLDKIKEEHINLKSHYNAVLQMYGEKAEEAEELKMDIEDVKNMYRQQIQELCGGAR